VKALFVELPALQRHRSEYFDDESFLALQEALVADPEAGDVIRDTGGLRKVRFADSRRGKGKRGGLRIIYYWWAPGCQFWLFTLCGKGEVSDLTAEQRKVVREVLKAELKARKSP
jgi:hypothetical protein